MTHIFEGKYKLYLNHCVCKLKENILKMTVSLDGVPLQEFPYPSKEILEKCREAHTVKVEGENNGEDAKEGANLHVMRPMLGLRRGPFMRIRQAPRTYYNQDNSLKKDFIMDINIPYDEIRDNGSGHELTIKFDHTEGSWKDGWLIDGVILESEKIEY